MYFRRKRNWRFHKGLKQWIYFSSNFVIISHNDTEARAIYTKFDCALWKKIRQEMTLDFNQFEQPHDYQL